MNQYTQNFILAANQIKKIFELKDYLEKDKKKLEQKS